MANKRARPDRVVPSLAMRALEDAKGDKQVAWTHYIVEHWRATGNLAPGCDMRDLWAWYEQHPVEVDEIQRRFPQPVTGRRRSPK